MGRIPTRNIITGLHASESTDSTKENDQNENRYQYTSEKKPVKARTYVILIVLIIIGLIFAYYAPK